MKYVIDIDNTIYAGAASVLYGASIIEVHVTLDKDMRETDQKASLNFVELKELKSLKDKFSLMMGAGELKVYESEVLIKKKLRG